MRKIYEVRRYVKTTLFDKNLRLVYRWIYVDKCLFTNKQDALRYFIACNTFTKHKAVLRVMKGGKHGKR